MSGLPVSECLGECLADLFPSVWASVWASVWPTCFRVSGRVSGLPVSVSLGECLAQREEVEKIKLRQGADSTQGIEKIIPPPTGNKALEGDGRCTIVPPPDLHPLEPRWAVSYPCQAAPAASTSR